jgi:hypothetical protein
MKTQWLPALLLAGLAAGAGYAGTPTARYLAPTRTVPVPVYANGKQLQTNALMLKGAARTVLPMRALFTTLGAQVVWNGRERAVYGWKTDGTGVRFGVGEAEAQLLLLPGAGGDSTVIETRKLDAPAMLINSRLYIPVRAASELLGTEVRWVGSEPAVYIGDSPPADGGAAASR